MSILPIACVCKNPGYVIVTFLVVSLRIGSPSSLIRSGSAHHMFFDASLFSGFFSSSFHAMLSHLADIRIGSHYATVFSLCRCSMSLGYFLGESVVLIKRSGTNQDTFKRLINTFWSFLENLNFWCKFSQALFNLNIFQVVSYLALWLIHLDTTGRFQLSILHCSS